MNEISNNHETANGTKPVLAGVNFTVMKTIIRWYYRVFQKDRCYKATLQDRLRNRWDCVDCCDKYIGADWWLRP